MSEPQINILLISIDSTSSIGSLVATGNALSVLLDILLLPDILLEFLSAQNSSRPGDTLCSELDSSESLQSNSHKNSYLAIFTTCTLKQDVINRCERYK